MKAQSELREMLQELLDMDEGLRVWEINFIDSLDRWEGDLTERQAETLEKIYDARVK